MTARESAQNRGPVRIVVLPGDGVGPEVIRETRKVLDRVGALHGLDLEFGEYPCGGRYYMESGEEWPADAFEACRDWAEAILLGAIGHPGARLPSGDLAGAGVIFGLRFGLDLYANVRPCRLFPGVKHRIHDRFEQIWSPESIDLVIVRENTEGCYTPARGSLRRGGETEMSVDARVITRKGSARVIRFAYELARSRSGAPRDGVHRLTCIDKSNVLAGCQLFREVFDEIGADYGDVERDYAYIDAFMQYLIRQPEQYDVAVTTNMMGDIATDLAAVIQGGMGLAASANLGDRHGMFEGVHGSAPNIAGQDKANPVASVMAAAMMLDWLGGRRGDPDLSAAARSIEAAVARAYASGAEVTGDLGGKASCSRFGDTIAGFLEAP